MKHTPISELEESLEMQAEYEFDYRQARLNRFAENPPLTVTLAPDVARVFTSAEAVNHALRALLSALPARVGASVDWPTFIQSNQQSGGQQ